MLPQRACNTQVLGFTQRLINLGLNSDVILYQSLCAAYEAMIDEKIAAGYAAIEGMAIPPAHPTAQTLQAAIETIIKTRKGK